LKTLNPFEIEGNWYKGCVHLHSTNSDGSLSPEELCQTYRAAGYDFIFLTDHWKITPASAVLPPGLLVLPGVEYNSESYHLLALNPKTLLTPEKLSAQEIIDHLNREGSLAFVAHPYWSGLTSRELLNLKGYLGIEVYNHTCEVTKGKGYSNVHWDELLQAGRKTWALAVDDGHHHPGPNRRDDLLKGFIMVRAKSLSQENILKAIKDGLFYSSTGALINHISVKNQSISVQCTPAVEIDFVSFNAQGGRFSGIEEEVTRAEFTGTGSEKYLRVEITDRQNQKAWTNPLWLDA